MDPILEIGRRDENGIATVSDVASGGDPPVITVENLHKVYGSGDDAVRAVDGVDFEIASGTAVGLLGPNGAGKTTTIKSLLGLIIPTEGRTLVHDIDIHERPAAAYRRIGAILEGARNVYWRLTVRENLRFFAALGGINPGNAKRRNDELLEQFGLADKADTIVSELSRGQKQKVSLTCTLARDADVIFLDEPTLGLDIESTLELRRELRDLVEDEGTTILLSSHDMNVIEDVCDRVIIMNNGTVVADDRVDSLLDLFNTRAYEVTVKEQLEDRFRQRLKREFDADAFERHGDRTQFEVRVTGDEFYYLVETLRTAGLSVDSFDSVDPDLEDIFLQITNDTSFERTSGSESEMR